MTTGYDFERFTDRARRVVVIAQDKAGPGMQFRPDHLFYGLVADGECVAALVLADLGVTAEAVAALITTPSEPIVDDRRWPTTTSRIFEFALREALQLGHNFIGTEHLLLAFTRAFRGRAGAVDTYGNALFAALGVTADVRRAVIEKLSGYATNAATPGAAHAGPGPKEQKARRFLGIRPTGIPESVYLRSLAAAVEQVETLEAGDA